MSAQNAYDVGRPTTNVSKRQNKLTSLTRLPQSVEDSSGLSIPASLISGAICYGSVMDGDAWTAIPVQQLQQHCGVTSSAMEIKRGLISRDVEVEHGVKPSS